MQKYKQIKINIPINDFEKIQEKAANANLKLSGYLKNMLINYNLLTIKKTKNTYKPCDPKLLYELNKLGNNLNQIARKLNINYEIDFKVLEKLELIEKELIEIKKAYL